MQQTKFPASFGATGRLAQRAANQALGCMSSAITGCFLAANPTALEAAAEALAAFGLADEDAAAVAKGSGTFHAALYDALYALTPESLDERARIA